MARKPLIYVSSTFTDLKEHRAALKSALEKAQYDVECMEKYPAFDERPLDRCLADVQRADVFVLVLAHRYGFRPRHGNPARKSITQLEYEAACEKLRLVFTVDDEHLWSPKLVDTGEDARDLLAFRAEVEDRHGVSRFSDPHHLASLVLQALTALNVAAHHSEGEAQDVGRQYIHGDGNAQAFGPGATASVEIHHHHYPEAPPASWNWPRPLDFSGYIAEKRRGFTGRTWLFDEVRRWYADSDGAQALLVCADYGVGKSAFMAELTANPLGLQIPAFHFCNHYVRATLDPATFVKNVAAQLAASLPDYRSAVDADPDARRLLEEVQVDPGSAFERAVVGPLHAINPPNAPQALLVDALDEALDFWMASSSSRTTIVRLLANHANHLPAWLRILATSRRRRDVLQPLQNAFRCATLDGEDDRNLDDIRDYVAGRCAGTKLAPIFEEGNKSASETAAFLSDARQSGGKFLYAVRVLNDVESGDLMLDRLNDLPPGMDAFYLDAFERRFPESEDYGPVGALLGVLCVQREPLSRVELAAILCTPETQVTKVLKRLEDFLRIRAKRYAFDHLSVAQWLSEENEDGFPRADRFSVDLHAVDRLIADWARRELASDRAHESAYLARHLATYLSAPEREVHFARLLFDFRWLDACLRAAGMDELLMDFANVDGTPAIRSLERALRRGAHVIGHDANDWEGADLLASQVLGRLQPRAEPEFQRLCAQAAGQLAHTGGLRPLTDSLHSDEALDRTLAGHRAAVSALALLDDGRLASGSFDETIRLWQPAKGTCEARLEGHSNSISALAVLPDGWLASGADDWTIKLWNPASGVCQATLEGHTSSVNALAVLADGRLASGSRDTTIRLWNLASGACEATLEGHTDQVFALALLVDGRLASGAADGTIRLWNPAIGVCQATLEGHTDQVFALALLADGRLASGSRDTTIRLWNLASGACEATLEGHTSSIRALTVLPDGWLASGGDDHTIRLWNLVSGTCETTLEGYAVSALAVLADGRFASASYDKTIRLWNLANGVGKTTPEGHTQEISALAVLADGRLASGSRDHTIRLWNPASGACEATLEGHTMSVHSLAVLPDTRLASRSSDQTIRLWNPASGVCEATLEAPDFLPTPLAALTDGRLASGSMDWINLWNPASGMRETILAAHTDHTTALATLADGKLASGAMDKIIRLWNTASGVCELTLEGHTSGISSFAVLADGRLASGSWDKTIKLWNLTSGACEATLEGHMDRVTALAVLADGRFASGSEDRSIRIWQIRDGRWTATVGFVADAGICALAFASHAGSLAAGDESGRLHFLKVETGALTV
ncbi:DUF4062 domain-containing protein [Paraburkholderia sp. HD33-4]|uniref:DUF4062 domain-containing protein n=1 Tax=Paraburkholderia sp. HD33-4 TaxID=2883242 RepID=UPI001F1AF30B|nr:DUF4062 domain-containing protein [Paraburkholderia sp. HD33-4]